MQILQNPKACNNRFTYLLIALVFLLAGYPYWDSYVGSLVTLGLIVAGVYAVHTNARIFRGALILGVLTAGIDIAMIVQGERSNPLVEGAFFVFFTFITVLIFVEVMRTRYTMADTLYGAVSVYLLIGISFGQLYDLVETLQPGSFTAGFLAEGDSPGWTLLIFYSFMTLTTIGGGDITSATDTTRSLAILIARLIGTTSTSDSSTDA